ncbi:MAG TPA: hypothetical protein VND65_07090 [Candidatus Binatia bacterium]|nr:hypothetical protein [Candidatus Binatia bacterium]
MGNRRFPPRNEGFGDVIRRVYGDRIHWQAIDNASEPTKVPVEDLFRAAYTVTEMSSSEPSKQSSTGSATAASSEKNSMDNSRPGRIPKEIMDAGMAALNRAGEEAEKNKPPR